MSSATFGFPGSPGWNLALAEPCEELAAHDLCDVLQVVERAEEAALAGRWVAVMLAYEAAPAFDPALCAHAPGPLPLAWAGIFDTAAALRPLSGEGFTLSKLRPCVARSDYDRALARVRELIRLGETYQVNYTIDFEAMLAGSEKSFYLAAARAQQAAYAARFDLGRWCVLSFSPELFFRRIGRAVVTRPMKGTAARGRFAAEDARRAAALGASDKDRAENVMITDLIRSDLGRVALPGTVKTRELFAVEALPSLFQMTSTVRARLREDTSLARLLGALFPCGSVTGAPKVAATRIIRDLEPRPRGPYCGALGYLAPGGDCVFSVPIRTGVLERDAGRLRMHAGGGITWGSTANGEYEECRAKLFFLDRGAPEFSLLESIKLENGRYPRLADHLRRLRFAAGRLGFPLEEHAVRRALANLGREHPKGRFKARLTVDAEGAVTAEAAPLGTMPRPLRLGVCREPVDSGDERLFFKTTARARYERALAAHPDCDDVLLVNERGEITESTRANVLVRLEGRLVTPAAECGLLPGVMRERLLGRGAVAEARLTIDDLRAAERIWLMNSVRGLLCAELAF